MVNVTNGIGLVLVSALANGTFAHFLQKRNVFKLEHTWSLSFLFGYLLLPCLILTLTIPGWPVMLSALKGAWIPVIVLGVGWGIASLFFINGINTMGLSAGYAIIFGVGRSLSVPPFRCCAAGMTLLLKAGRLSSRE